MIENIIYLWYIYLFLFIFISVYFVVSSFVGLGVGIFLSEISEFDKEPFRRNIF